MNPQERLWLGATLGAWGGQESALALSDSRELPGLAIPRPGLRISSAVVFETVPTVAASAAISVLLGSSSFEAAKQSPTIAGPSAVMSRLCHLRRH